MFGDNKTVVDTASIPHGKLQKRHNALSFHRTRFAIAAGTLNFYHIPVDRSGLTREMVDNFHGAVTQSAGKVLAYCRSGQRSSMLWQACGSP